MTEFKPKTWRAAQLRAALAMLEGDRRPYWWLVVLELVVAWKPILYRLLNVGERRCSWCHRFMGWRRGIHGLTTHGICDACSAQFDTPITAEKHPRSKQSRPRRNTLRRRIGSWSGAVARTGHVSH